MTHLPTTAPPIPTGIRRVRAALPGSDGETPGRRADPLADPLGGTDRHSPAAPHGRAPSRRRSPESARPDAVPLLARSPAPAGPPTDPPTGVGSEQPGQRRTTPSRRAAAATAAATAGATRSSNGLGTT